MLSECSDFIELRINKYFKKIYPRIPHEKRDVHELCERHRHAGERPDRGTHRTSVNHKPQHAAAPP